MPPRQNHGRVPAGEVKTSAEMHRFHSLHLFNWLEPYRLKFANVFFKITCRSGFSRENI